MKLLVMSDSHGNRNAVMNALSLMRRVTPPDAVIFLGDGLRDIESADLGGIPLYAVCGNCDMFTSFSAFGAIETPRPRDEMLVSFGKYNFLLMHGHKFGVKSSFLPAAEYAASRGADVLLFGHTHERYEGSSVVTDKSGNEKKILLFNPGSVGEYSGGWGVVDIGDGDDAVAGAGADISFSYGNNRRQ